MATAAPLDIMAAFNSAAGHPPASSISTWLVWGGEITVLFNPDALRDLGLTVEDVRGSKERIVGEPGVRYESMIFSASDSDALEIQHVGSTIHGVGGGALRSSHGFSLRYAGGVADLHGIAVRGQSGTLLGIEVADAKGNAWFTADHAHYGFDNDERSQYAMRNMNLRIAPQFAATMGKPELAGHPIGGFAFVAKSYVTKTAQPEATCAAPFPGVGLTTDIQMIYDDAANSWTGHDDKVYTLRCSLPPVPGAACTAASTNGKIVITPDSSLRNVGQTAVAWYEKFTSPSPPYSNDQHPFLVWNLYRVDSNGQIRQLAASAVKHAFLTINFNCPCTAPSSHIIYPQCEDTYAFQNNDNTTTGGTPKGTLAPRNEVIPFVAKWGRCGSIYDANCDGAIDAGSGPANLYQYRLQGTESDFLPPLSTGAHYYLEYWYVVRDDPTVYNTMAYREIQLQKTGATWAVTLTNVLAADHDFFLGPVINHWVDPVTPGAGALNSELMTSEGRARVAVKSTSLGGGQWRYDYAVMNLDLMHAVIDPAHNTEPNLKLLSNNGIVSFSVPIPDWVTVTAPAFADAGNAVTPWTYARGAQSVQWTAATGADLTWGMVYRFSFVANAAPAAARATLLPFGASPTPNVYDVDSLVPANDEIFADNFEGP